LNRVVIWLKLVSQLFWEGTDGLGSSPPYAR